MPTSRRPEDASALLRFLNLVEHALALALAGGGGSAGDWHMCIINKGAGSDISDTLHRHSQQQTLPVPHDMEDASVIHKW